MAPNQNLRRQVPRRLFLLRLNERGDVVMLLVVFSHWLLFLAASDNQNFFIEGLWRVPSEFHKP